MAAPDRIWIDGFGGHWWPVFGGTQEEEYVAVELLDAAEARIAALTAQVEALRGAVADAHEWMVECIRHSPNPDITHENFRVSTWRNAILCRDKLTAALATEPRHA